MQAATPSTARAARAKRAPAGDGAGQQARNRILDASLALFARHGFEGVSTTRIAADAGISQSVVLYHFRSKEKLWRAAMLHLFARIGVAGVTSTADIKDLDPLSQLRVSLRRFVRLSARHPELGRIIMREGSEGGARLTWLVRNALAANYAVYTGLVSAAQASGQVKPYPPFHLTILLHAACSMLFNLQPLVEAVDGAPLDAGAGLEALSDMILDTLIDGIGIRPENRA
jgi:TetR/AcrR family transcriptional regulator